MRKELYQINGVRTTFTGTFIRFGAKRNFKGGMDKTILFQDICNAAGEKVSDHLWFNYTKDFSSLKLHPGDVVAFDARVAEYAKGYQGWREEVEQWSETDYKLSRPTRLRKTGEMREFTLLDEI